jgi:hypothetical protein
MTLRTKQVIIGIVIFVEIVVFIALIFQATAISSQKPVASSTVSSHEISSICYWGVENCLRDPNFAVSPKGQQYREKVIEFLKDNIITYDELWKLEALSKEVDDIKQANFNKIHKDGIKQELEFRNVEK